MGAPVKVSEIILLSLFAVFSGVLLVNSLAMPYSSENGFDVGFVPTNMSVVIIVLAGLIGLRALLHKNKTQVDTSEVKADEKQTSESNQRQSLVPPISTILLLLVATAAMGVGSVLLPLAVVMTAVSTFFLGNGWFRSIRMTIVSLAVIYLIFAVWLKIPIT